MFTVTSNPFAKMTQGLSGQPQEGQQVVSTNITTALIEYETDDQYKYEKNHSSNWGTVTFLVLIFFSSIGLGIWIYLKYQKEEELKKIEEENKKNIEKQTKITPFQE